MTGVSKAETAKFVCAHAKELARLAKDAGLHNLAYLLDVAALEAETNSASDKSEEAAR